MEFAQSHIPERAAWPKAIHVVEKLPLTNVGKIFKPELQRREIEDVIRAEAAAIRAELREFASEGIPPAASWLAQSSSAAVRS